MAGTETTQGAVRADAMRTLMERLFVRVGVPADDAATAANVLMFSDLYGIDSHGVAADAYVPHTLSPTGRVNLHPNITVLAEGPATLTMDGDHGLGPRRRAGGDAARALPRRRRRAGVPSRCARATISARSPTTRCRRSRRGSAD